MSAIRRTHPGAWAALVLLAALSVPALSAPRVALVIGNAAYAHAPPLANPLNDAADIGAALGRLGFDVTRVENAGYSGLRRALGQFSLAASGAEMAVVFYAGHGIEVGQRNYLVPVDAQLASDRLVEYEAMPLEQVQQAVQGATGLRLVILDACRENPFVAKMERAGATRSIGRGLARVEPSGETLVAYAAKGGTVALDGTGRNSPYSNALLEHLEQPGLEVMYMFRAVRDAVLEATGGQQEPFWYGSLSSREVYLAQAQAPVAAPPAAAVPAADSRTAQAVGEAAAARAYEAAERVNTVQAYEVVIRRYPGSVYADLARAHIAKLAAAQEPATGAAAIPAATAAESASGQPAAQDPAPAPVDSTPKAMEASLGLGPAERRRIQAGLASLGFEPGLADGLFGPRTRDAIRRYQGEKGSDATGYVTEAEAEALAALGEEAVREQAAARREAERRADDAAFAKAMSAGTVEAFESYPKAFPRGAHVEHARRLLAEAKRAERARLEKAPGRRFRDCPECPELVVVLSGSYRMGSPSWEAGRDDEGPVHRFTIVKPFAVGVYEVTFGEWDVCRRGGGCSHNPDDRDWGRGLRPVVNVSWDDAQKYVRWLSRETGERYRLLSESEWEYVARAGTETRYHWGHAIGHNRANCRGCGSRWDARQTSPVGSFSPNAFGLHDVHGNVWEWVEDCWHGDYSGAPRDGGAWTIGGDCSRHVLRGGSWGSGPRGVRSATRIWYTTGSRLNYAGFRVARTLD